MKTLVVDDNEQLLDMIQIILEMEGHDVVVASSPVRGALLASQGAFDLLITDIRMPQISGRALVREVRGSSLNADIAVIMISGQAEEEMKGCDEYGDCRYLRKPFSSEELLGAVAEVTSARS